MPENIKLNDLATAEGKAGLRDYLLKLAEDGETIYTESAPNGVVSAKRGKIAIYKNGSTYEQWQNIDGGTTWQRMDVETKGLLDVMEYSSDANAQAAYVTNASATATITQSNIVGSTNTALPHGAVSQGFKTSTTDNIPKISFKLFKASGTTGTITGGIYATDGSGHPTGSALATFSTKDASTLTESTDGEVVDFTGNFTPTAGTQYCAVATMLNSGSGNWGTRYDTSSVYADGIGSYQDPSTAWTNMGGDHWFRVYQDVKDLQSFSESTIKTQGSYALKAVATITDSLNKTLTRTVSPTINLSNVNTLRFDIRSTRTGANIKIGIHDSGGTTTEKTYTVLAADTWETVTWDISAVANADKDAIDSIIITIVNADAANTFYIDNFYAILIYAVI